MLATCEVWAALPGGRWGYVNDLPAGVGVTLLDLEDAITMAGYSYPCTAEDQPAWHVVRDGAPTYTLDVRGPLP